MVFVSFEFVRHPDFARSGFIPGYRGNYFWGEFLRSPGRAFYGCSHMSDRNLIIQIATARYIPTADGFNSPDRARIVIIPGESKNFRE